MAGDLRPKTGAGTGGRKLGDVIQTLSMLLAERRRQLNDPAARQQIEWVEQILQTLMILQAPPTAGIPGAGVGGYLARQVAIWRTICELRSIAIDLDLGEPVGPRDGRVTLANALTEATLVQAANELVFNALKHAFPGRASGRIHVALGQRAGNLAELAVTDDGVGLASDLFPAGSGLNLLEEAARRLGGALLIENGVGTTVRLRLPVD